MKLVKAVGLLVLGLVHLGITVTVACVGYDRMHFLYYGNSRVAAAAVYQIPETSNEIVLELRTAHLFLAEYDRELVLRIGKREVVRKTVAADSGGYSKMKIYRTSPTTYFLCGELSFDAYTLDAMARTIMSVGFEEDFSETVYVGVFDRDENRQWRFISAGERSDANDTLFPSGCSKHTNDIRIANI